MSNNLGQIEKILSTVERKDEFKFSDILGSLINNRRFSEGYNRFAEGQKDDSTYVWECLSAIGQEVGTTLHTCV